MSRVFSAFRIKEGTASPSWGFLSSFSSLIRHGNPGKDSLSGIPLYLPGQASPVRKMVGCLPLLAGSQDFKHKPLPTFSQTPEHRTGAVLRRHQQVEHSSQGNRPGIRPCPSDSAPYPHSRPRGPLPKERRKDWVQEDLRLSAENKL